MKFAAIRTALVAGLFSLAALPAHAVTVRFTINSEMQYFSTSYGDAGGWFDFDTVSKTVTDAEMTSSWDNPAGPSEKVTFDESHSSINEPVAGGIIISFARVTGPGAFDYFSLSTRFTQAVVDAANYGDLLSFTDSKMKGGQREPFDIDLVELTAELVDPPTGVPLPAAVWLLAAGLGGLGMLRRRSRPR